MLEKLQIVKQRFDEVSDLIIQPDIISDQKRYVELNREYKDLRILMDKREKYIELTNNLAEAEGDYSRWQRSRNGRNGQNAVRRGQSGHSQAGRRNKSPLNTKRPRRF